MKESAFENAVCEMAAILSRGRWVYRMQASKVDLPVS